MKTAASWIRRGGIMGREGGGWSVSLRARFFLVGKVAGHTPRNARRAARFTDPPVLLGSSDGWMARMGASGIRRGERMRGAVASGFGKLALAEVVEGSEMENSNSRVGTGRSRRRPWTGFLSGTPVRIVRMSGVAGFSNGSCFDWHGIGFLLNGRGFDVTVCALDFMRRRRYRAGS